MTGLETRPGPWWKGEELQRQKTERKRRGIAACSNPCGVAAVPPEMKNGAGGEHGVFVMCADLRTWGGHWLSLVEVAHAALGALAVPLDPS